MHARMLRKNAAWCRSIVFPKTHPSRPRRRLAIGRVRVRADDIPVVNLVSGRYTDQIGQRQMNQPDTDHPTTARRRRRSQLTCLAAVINAIRVSVGSERNHHLRGRSSFAEFSCAHLRRLSRSSHRNEWTPGSDARRSVRALIAHDCFQDQKEFLGQHRPAPLVMEPLRWRIRAT